MHAAAARLAARPPVFSPDGRYLYVPCGSTVRAHSTTTGALLFTLKGHTAPVTGVALHPQNPRQILTSSLDMCVCAWDADDGTCLRTYRIGAPVTHIASCALPPKVPARIVIAVLEQEAPGAARDGEEAGSDSEEGEKAHSRARKQSSNGAEEGGAKVPNGTAPTARRRVSFSSSTPAGGEDASAVASSYPLGDEVACLRPRAMGVSMAFTLDSNGLSRARPRSRVEVFDLHANARVRVLASHKGFVTGLDAQCRGVQEATAAHGGVGLVADVVVAFTIRHTMYVWRSNALGECVTAYKGRELLSTCSVHPLDGYAVTGDIFGHIKTWFAPELAIEANEALGQATGTHAATTPLQATAAAVAASARSKTGADGVPSVPLRTGNASVPNASVHWHSHSVWATAFTPDGSYLVSGGEESVAVLWRLSAGNVASAGAAGPQRDKKTMTFLPRLGAPIRTVGVFARPVGMGDGGAAIMTADAATSGTHVRETPALMVALGLVDNSVIVLNGTTLQEMWRSRGLAVAGLPALPTVGVLNSLARHRNRSRSVAKLGGTAVLMSAAEQISHAMRGGAGSSLLPGVTPDLATTLRAPEKLGLGDRSTLLSATTRYLRRGVIVDPRTKALVVNGIPGKASLQWFDPRKESEVIELEVAPHNTVSRLNEDPPPPIRVTHVAFSHDGLCMATIEVYATLDVGTDTTTLKLWSWSAADGRYVVNTRIETPHKTEVTCCEFHPTHRLVVTGSRDRTFKLWEETTSAPILSSAKEVAAASMAQQKASSKSSAGQGAAGKTTFDPPAGGPAAPATAPALVWQCRSVGFFRDLPVTAAAFSGDGTCLALAYGHIITLWDWRDNSLRKTLCDSAHTGTDGPAHVGYLAFAGLSATLVAASSKTLTVWDVLSCTPAWSYAAHVCSVAVDRVGLATSTRFAVVVRGAAEGGPADSDAPTRTSKTELLQAPPAKPPVALVFDATSPVPISVTRIPVPTLAREIDETALPTNMRTAAYAAAFVPPAQTAGATAPKAHDVVVLGAMNEVHRIAIPAAALPAAAQPAAEPSTAGASARAAAPAAGGVRAYGPSAVSARHGLLAAATHLGASAQLGDQVAAGTTEASFATLLSSFGPTQALPPTTMLFDSLMSALLPPAPAPAPRAQSATSAPDELLTGDAVHSVDALTAARVADAALRAQHSAALDASDLSAWGFRASRTGGVTHHNSIAAPAPASSSRPAPSSVPAWIGSGALSLLAPVVDNNSMPASLAALMHVFDAPTEMTSPGETEAAGTSKTGDRKRSRRAASSDAPAATTAAAGAKSPVAASAAAPATSASSKRRRDSDTKGVITTAGTAVLTPPPAAAEQPPQADEAGGIATRKKPRRPAAAEGSSTPAPPAAVAGLPPTVPQTARRPPTKRAVETPAATVPPAQAPSPALPAPDSVASRTRRRTMSDLGSVASTSAEATAAPAPATAAEKQAAAATPTSVRSRTRASAASISSLEEVTSSQKATRRSAKKA